MPYPPPPPETDPRLLQRGGALAAIGSIDTGVQACAECHGPEGLGRPPDVPYLAGQFANYARLQLEEWMRGERANDRFGVMRNIAMRLSREDRRWRPITLPCGPATKRQWMPGPCARLAKPWCKTPSPTGRWKRRRAARPK